MTTNIPQDLLDQAQQGDADAQFELGHHYAVNDDMRTSMACYRKAAEAGHPVARYLYGTLCLDDAEALKWLEKCAHQDYAPCQTELARRIQAGNGSDSDPQEALAWLYKAARHGDKEALMDLGSQFEYGVDVPLCKTLAFVFYGYAADIIYKQAGGAGHDPIPQRAHAELATQLDAEELALGRRLLERLINGADLDAIVQEGLQHNLKRLQRIKLFERWALSEHAGFYNQNFESPLWTISLEPDEQLDDPWTAVQAFIAKKSVPDFYTNTRAALQKPANYNLAKVIASAYGVDVKAYRHFAEKTHLWVEGGFGLKASLYPLAVKKLKAWPDSYRNLFHDEVHYKLWCSEWCWDVRFPWLREKVKVHWPALIIATGNKGINAFKHALVNEEYLVEEGELPVPATGHHIHYFLLEKEGAGRQLICITPPMVGVHGISSYEKAERVGDFLRNLTIKYQVALQVRRDGNGFNIK